MRQGLNKNWMVRPKSFVKLLGAEYDILQRAGSGVMTKFYLSGMSIIVIFLLSVGSIRYAIDLLFNDWPTEILLSGFFSLLFACIYIFLINTFSKEQLPGNSQFFSSSNLIRTGFIIFIAYLVAQPLTILVAGQKLAQQTKVYKQQLFTAHGNAIEAFYKDDLTKLTVRRNYCFTQASKYATNNFNAEIASIDASISSIATKIEGMKQKADRKIGNSKFFLYQVKAANHFRKSWLFSGFVIILFLLPGYLIYSISSDNAYYRLKKEYEKNIVQRAYAAFTIQYQHIFQSRFGVAVEIFSRFDDPPFKRVRKLPPTSGSMDDFFKKYLSAPKY